MSLSAETDRLRPSSLSKYKKNFKEVIIVHSNLNTQILFLNVPWSSKQL